MFIKTHTLKVDIIIHLIHSCSILRMEVKVFGHNAFHCLIADSKCSWISSSKAVWASHHCFRVLFMFSVVSAVYFYKYTFLNKWMANWLQKLKCYDPIKLGLLFIQMSLSCGLGYNEKKKHYFLLLNTRILYTSCLCFSIGTTPCRNPLQEN